MCLPLLSAVSLTLSAEAAGPAALGRVRGLVVVVVAGKLLLQLQAHKQVSILICIPSPYGCCRRAKTRVGAIQTAAGMSCFRRRPLNPPSPGPTFTQWPSIRTSIL